MAEGCSADMEKKKKAFQEGLNRTIKESLRPQSNIYEAEYPGPKPTEGDKPPVDKGK